MEAKIQELNEEEKVWIEGQIDAAKAFISKFSPTDAVEFPNLAALDRAWSAWLDSNPGDTANINETINCVGMAFGRSVSEATGLRWVIATDNHGTDLALFGLPGKGDFLIYPANFVAKRWERREKNFLERSQALLKADIERVSSDCSKPRWKFW
jgi:Domain of unknown function (DUF3806)